MKGFLFLSMVVWFSLSVSALMTGVLHADSRWGWGGVVSLALWGLTMTQVA